MINAKTGFITEVDLTSTQPSRNAVSEENVVKELVKDYSAYMMSNMRKSLIFRKDIAKETQLNSLSDQITRKKATLKQLKDTLNRLHLEESGSKSEELKEIDEKLKFALEAEGNEIMTRESYGHVLKRTQANREKAEDRMKMLRKEVRGYTEMLDQGRTQHQSILMEQIHTDSELHELRETLEQIRSEREMCRQMRIRKLQGEHREMDEEWVYAKQEKVKEIVRARNVDWLRQWLRRQREVRKILHLHMGLEELAKHRVDSIIQSVIDNLGGSNVDEALFNYQQKITQYKSLLQEAEFKLSLQASYERKLVALFAELRGINEQLRAAGPKDYFLRFAKSEIHFSHTTSKMKSAQTSFRREVKAKEGNKQMAIEAISQCKTLLDLLSALDGFGEAVAVGVSMENPGEVVKGFLVLEKRLRYLEEVTVQRRWRRTGKETLIQMLQYSPRLRPFNTQFPLNSTSPSPISEQEHLPDQPLSTSSSRSSHLKLFKDTTPRNLHSPKELFTARMRIYKDFLHVKSSYLSIPKGISPAPEMLFRLRQSERKLECFTQPRNRRFPGRKSEKSAVSDRQGTLLALARSYLSTRSDSHTAPSYASNSRR